MRVLRTMSILFVATALVFPALAQAAPPVIRATTLVLPAPNKGLYQGFLPAFACTALGNCFAAGAFVDGNSHQQGVLYTENAGLWLTPVAVVAPRNAARPNPGVTMDTAACGALGSCTALGSFVDTAGNQQAFVVTTLNTVAQPSQLLEMPTNALARQLLVQPHSLACWGPGNCVAVGTYTSGNIFATQGFIATQRRGVWRRASEVVLPADANSNPVVTLTQVTCWGNANCAAVGSYVNRDNVTRAIVIRRTGGGWHPAQLIALPPGASAYAGASLSEVSCVAATCTAIGSFTSSNGTIQPMASTMSGGVWGTALPITLPSDAAATTPPFLWDYQGISCASVGNCTFGGDYVTTSGAHQGYVVNEVKGSWQPATTLVLPAGAVDAGANGGVIDVSCPTAGNCTAAAAFRNAKKQYETMLITETNDVWGPAQPISLPRGAASVGVDGGIYGLYCSTSCEVTGSYLAGHSSYVGFSAHS